MHYKIFLLYSLPGEIQDLRACCEDCGIWWWSPGNWPEGRWDFWRRKASTITVPETAMAVARTTPCEQSEEDMVDESRKGTWIKYVMWLAEYERICFGRDERREVVSK